MDDEDKKFIHFLGQWEEFRKTHDENMEEIKGRVKGVNEKVKTVRNRLDEMENKFHMLATIWNWTKATAVALVTLLLLGVDDLIKYIGKL